MGTHVVVGAGPVGTATAHQLVERGHRVRMVTRSGSGPDHPDIERVAADATDPVALAGLCRGADAIVNAANPPYHRWAEQWPPLAASLLGAAESTGAVLVTMGNLYGYGPQDRPLVEDDPLEPTSRKGRVRADLWAQALAAHRAGRVRVTEARASDFYGPGLGASSHFGRWTRPLLAGRRAYVIGRTDVVHSWTAVADVGRTLAVLATEPAAWGRPWHVPTPPPRTQAELAGRFCTLAGAPAPRLVPVPPWLLRLAGTVRPELGEIDEIRYQFERPFVVDSSACTAAFGIEPTPVDEVLAATADALGRPVPAAAT